LRPPDPRASLVVVAKRGTIRASDADRDLVVDRLHKAATEGRIGSDELEERVSTALKARTYGELEATLTDLPSSDRRTRHPAQRSAPRWALSTMRANPWLIVFAIPVLAVTAAMLLAVTVLWAAIAVVALMVGGRPTLHRGPLGYTRRQVRAPRRGPGSYWA
jgi:hypothetical protein